MLVLLFPEFAFAVITDIDAGQDNFTDILL